MASARVRIPPGLAGKVAAASRDPAGREMLRRGLRVESAAKRRLGSSPRRIDTGRLRADINTRQIPHRGGWGARVSSGLDYALYVHEGTGRYGPRHTDIRPKTARALRFTPKGSRQAIFRMRSKGMKPNPFLRDALRAARG